MSSIVSSSNIESHHNDKLKKKGLKDFLATKHEKLRKQRGHKLHQSFDNTLAKKLLNLGSKPPNF